jgi:hypothetical protein
LEEKDDEDDLLGGGVKPKNHDFSLISIENIIVSLVFLHSEFSNGIY